MALSGSNPGQRLGGGIGVVDNGVADLRVGDGLDIGEEESDFARRKLVAGNRLGRLVPDPFHFMHACCSTTGGSSGPCACVRPPRASG